MASCCIAIKREIKAPMFDLTEHSATVSDNEGANDDSNSNTTSRCTMDIQKTLSPSPRLPYIGAKLFIMAWAISTLSLSIVKFDFPSFWIVYLTHWGFIVTTAYTIMSFFSAVYLAMRPPANPGVLEGGVGLFAKITWALFSVTLPTEILITILYWALVFDYSEDEVVYHSVMAHGGMVPAIMIDGFLLSCLPLRMKQFILLETGAFLFVLWSIIHAFSGIGNPYVDSGEKSDDAIYTSLAWKNNTVGAVIVALIVLFVVSPIIFLFCRALSRIRPRRMCEEGVGQQIYKGQHCENEEVATDGEAVAVVY